MKVKKCISCNIEKVVFDYYKHSGMADGHLNKCKQCCKSESNKRYSVLYQNEEFVNSERKRAREKYKRLGYYLKHQQSFEAKPWKNTSIYKGLHKKMKCEKGYELHHWNYNDKYLEDVIVLPISIHRKIHKKMNLDLDKKIFKYNNEYLDTIEKHKLAIEEIIKLCL
jgi:hypothetical protein